MSQTIIKCPNEECGNSDLSLMKYVEDVRSTRHLEGIGEDGTLHISQDSNEWVEHAENSRLSCKVCLKDFPLPESYDLVSPSVTAE